MNHMLIDIVVTLSRVLGWTALSWILGVIIGYMCFKQKQIQAIAQPVVNFFRHISPFCWLPVVVLIAGIGEISVGIVLVSAMLFNAIVMTTETLNSLPKDMIEHALMDGAYGINLIRYIEIPLCGRALSNIFRIIWSVGWSAIIAAEMLGVQSGMGYRLLDFRYLLRYREMFIYIGIIGLIGIVTDYLLLAMLQNRKSFT